MSTVISNGHVHPIDSDNSDSLRNYWKPTNERKIGFCFNLRSLFLVSFNSRLHDARLQSASAVQEERHRHLATFPWTIHPYSDFRWGWIILMTIILLVTLISQPLQLAFYSSEIGTPTNVAINSVINFIFILDIVFHFRTGYTVGGRSSNVAELNPKLIANRYVRRWFVLDLISSIPFDILYPFLEDGDGDGAHASVIVVYLRLLGLLKVFRISRVVRYIGKILRAYKFQAVTIRVTSLLVMILFLVHWLACLHYLVADWVNSSDPLANPESWLSQMKLWNKSVLEKYAHCALRALSNMCCLGYGLITPVAPEDVVCTLISIVIGATCFAMFLANISSVVLSLHQPHRHYNDALDETLDYMRFNNMPDALQYKVVTYYQQRYRSHFYNEKEILAKLSDALQKEVQLYSHRHLIGQVHLFDGVSPQILNQIVAKFQVETYLPGDVIIAVNTVGDCMYFIDEGKVDIIGANGVHLGRLVPGSYFGEISLVTDEPRVASVVAHTYCHVYRLDRTDFEHVLKRYPDVYHKIASLAQERSLMTRNVLAAYGATVCSCADNMGGHNQAYIAED